MLGRVTNGAGRERDEDAPARSLDIAPTQVRDAGGGRRRGVIVVAGLGLVIAAAVGIAQLGDVGVAGLRDVDRDGVTGVAPAANGPMSLPTVNASPTIAPAAI